MYTRGILILVSCVLLTSGILGKTNEDTDRIRLLHIGLAFLRPDHPDPVFMCDPKIDLTMVPAFSTVMEMAEIHRMMRLYLPRTKKELADGVDLVLIDGVDALHITDKFLRWTSDLVLESDMSFVMSDSGSGWSFDGSGTSWYITSIEPILSVDDKPGREAAAPGYVENSFKLIPTDPSHELMRNIPWDEMSFVAMNRPTERPGAKVLARMSPNKPVNRGKPVIAYIDFPGGGRSASYILTWHTMVGTANILQFYRWRWHYDVLVHMIYWPAGEPIPEDLLVTHEVRELFTELYYARTFVLSTIEFAEKSGGNLRQIELKLGDLDASRREIDRLYIGNEMLECRELSIEARDLYEVLIGEALKAKDRALFWIFLLEWIVVSATSMIAGAVLWTLLVRRRLYREVDSTRIMSYR